MKYLALELPAPIRNLKIKEDVGFQIRQRELFRERVKLGPEVVPVVFQPLMEPEGGELRAIFIAPGENHLVFIDEIAPTKVWDEWYRAYRIWSLGRTADIESIEITESEVIYHWNYSFLNLYESGLHHSGRQAWTGALYSSTWNHMLNNKPQVPILLRDGYRKMEPKIHYGDREAAEAYARSL